MNDDERVMRHAVAHFVAAVEKARAELEAQALARCRLAEEFKDPEDREDRRAYEAWRGVDREAQEHVRLALEVLGLAIRMGADGEVFATLQARAGGDDLAPEEVLEEARRRRIAQDRAFALMTTRLEDLTRLDGFDPDGFQRGGEG